MPWVHNLYLEVLAEQGIVGLVALVGLLATALRLIRTAARTSLSADGRLLGTGIHAALLAICVTAFVELTFVREWVAVVTLSLLGLTSNHAALRRDKRKELR